MQSIKNRRSKNIFPVQFTSCSTQEYAWHEESEWSDDEKLGFISVLARSADQNHWRHGPFFTKQWLCSTKSSNEPLYIRFYFFEGSFNICEVETYSAPHLDNDSKILFLLCALHLNFNVDLFRLPLDFPGSEKKQILSFDPKQLNFQHRNYNNLSLSENSSPEIAKIFLDLNYLKTRQKNYSDLLRFEKKIKSHPLIRLLTFGRRKR